ncbi:MAG: hypothetical protein M0Q24_11435, partial [Sulfurimonas sp.]|uniref:hypothetical protein n=1 Tax=Sulfurimonas sp. TaxID=2022749 RepID=UPI0025DDB8FF
MKSIIFTFAKRCLLLGILFFALLGFQGKANASTQNIFIDDFQSYNLGATKTELENNSYYYPDLSYYDYPIIKNDNGFIGLGSTNRGIDFIYDPPTDITTTPTDIKSLFFTIKAENGVYKDSPSWWQVYGNGQTQSLIQALFSINQNGLVKVRDSKNAITHEYTPTDLNEPIDFEITFNQITGVYTFKINGNIIFSGETYSSISNEPIDFFRFTGSGFGIGVNNPYIINNVAFVYGDFNPFDADPAYIWADWCGSDAGTLIETTPVNLCDVGTAGTVGFDGSKWSWDCIDGV